MAPVRRDEIDRLSAEAAKLRGHMCIGIPLGVRMGLKGLKLLGMKDNAAREKLMVVVETNTCAADGIQVSTGCTAGGRKLRVFEYGRSAATFYDGVSGRGFRIATRPTLVADATELAIKDGLITRDQIVGENSQIERRITMNAVLKMRSEELLTCRRVRIVPRRLLLQSKHHKRTLCGGCGEVIMDGMGVKRGEYVFCEPCLRGSYYTDL